MRIDLAGQHRAERLLDRVLAERRLHRHHRVEVQRAVDRPVQPGVEVLAQRVAAVGDEQRGLVRVGGARPRAPVQRHGPARLRHADRHRDAAAAQHRHRLTHDFGHPGRLEREVHPVAARQLPHGRHRIGRARVHHVRRPHPRRPREFRGNEVDRDDPFGSGQACALQRGEADATQSHHRDGGAAPDARGVQGRPEPGRYPAPQQAHARRVSTLRHPNDLRGMDDGMGRQRAQRERAHQRFAGTRHGEPRRLRPGVRAQTRRAPQAGPAAPAREGPGQEHAVVGRHRVDVRPHVQHGARALVTEQHRERVAPVAVLHGPMVAVTHAAGIHADAHLPRLRRIDPDRLHTDRPTEPPHHGPETLDGPSHRGVSGPGVNGEPCPGTMRAATASTRSRCARNTSRSNV